MITLKIALKEIMSLAFFNKKGYKKYLSLATSIILMAFFIFLECFLYIMIFNKVDVFIDLNYSLIIIILSIFTFIGTIYSMITCNKIFFSNKKERIILGISPVNILEVIIGKLIFVYLKTFIYFTSTFFVFALTYGIKVQTDFIYFIWMFLSIFILSLMSVGLGILFTIPFREIIKLVVRFKIISFILIVILIILLAVGYNLLMKLFIDLLRNASLDTLFTTQNVETLKNVANSLYPLKSVVDYALVINSGVNALIVLAFSLLSILFGVFFFYFYLKNYYHNDDQAKDINKVKSKKVKLISPIQALIKKEFLLLLNNNDGLFSYIFLVILQPFLVYSVISSLNLIFSTGNFIYINTLFPEIYLCVDILPILLFLSVINMTSSMSLTKERQTLIIMKTIPVSFFKQVLVKLGVNFVVSLISYIATLITLIATKEISLYTFLFLIIIGTLALLCLNIISIKSDFKFKANSDLLSILVGFVFPILYVVIATIFIIFIETSQTEIVFLSVITVLELITLGILLIKFKSKVTEQFLNYEGVSL